MEKVTRKVVEELIASDTDLNFQNADLSNLDSNLKGANLFEANLYGAEFEKSKSE